MVRRFLRDESGMTLGLAIMMVLLFSVMGAGLLTFVSRDLNTVIETNRGQWAFEVADAGIAAAERQLEPDCIEDEVVAACRTAYDSDGAGDSQWDVAEGGLTLNNLDGVATTSDSVTVTIDYREFQDAPNDFKVISTGSYGDSRRKIEAIFKPIAGGGGGGNVINPAYYTPSDIRLWSDGTNHGGVDVKGMSLFSEGNIYIEGLLPYTSCVEPRPPGSPMSAACLEKGIFQKQRRRHDYYYGREQGARQLELYALRSSWQLEHNRARRQEWKSFQRSRLWRRRDDLWFYY